MSLVICRSLINEYVINLAKRGMTETGAAHADY